MPLSSIIPPGRYRVIRHRWAVHITAFGSLNPFMRPPWFRLHTRIGSNLNRTRSIFLMLKYDYVYIGRDVWLVRLVLVVYVVRFWWNNDDYKMLSVCKNWYLLRDTQDYQNEQTHIAARVFRSKTNKRVYLYQSIFICLLRRAFGTIWFANKVTSSNQNHSHNSLQIGTSYSSSKRA